LTEDDGWNDRGWPSSSSSSRSICLYFKSPEGCKKGAECRWWHTDEAGSRDPKDDFSVHFNAGWKAQLADFYGSGQNSQWGDKPNAKLRLVPCAFYQLNCCYYDATCQFAHVPVDKEENIKTTLCAQFWRSGSCAREPCPDAHRKEELETPKAFLGMPGFKACLCTFHIVGECKDDPCFNAHGELDVRRLPMAVPRSLAREEFMFSDAHVHLDHVLYSRRYGAYWFYKNQTCRKIKCPYGRKCLFLHPPQERQFRPVDVSDFQELAAEIKAVHGTFAGCVHNCCDIGDIETAVRLVQWGREFLEGKVYVTFGVHPSTFEDFTPEVEERLKVALDKCGKQAVGWGECGLDYYRRMDDIEDDPSVRERMQDVFRRQALIAVRRGLPLVVHSRDAEEDTLAVLYRVVPPTHPVHLHSFMGSVKTLNEFLRRYRNGFMGVAGVVTYDGVQHHQGGLSELVRALPLDRLLLETDGPFMAPSPYRGEESHPGHIPWVADGVAKLKNVTAAEVLAAAHANFRRVYAV